MELWYTTTAAVMRMLSLRIVVSLVITHSR